MTILEWIKTEEANVLQASIKHTENFYIHLQCTCYITNDTFGWSVHPQLIDDENTFLYFYANMNQWRGACGNYTMIE